MKRFTGIIGIAALLFVAGCAMVSIYVTFPEEKIKKAADSIEGGIDEAAPAKKTSLLMDRFLGQVFAAEACAAEISSELKTDSPKIQAAAKLRASWREELDSYKQQGFVGENNKYQIEMRNAPSDQDTLKKVQALVKKENEQRKIIIDELIAINSAASQQREAFQAQFAKARRDHAKPGEWIQDTNGDWSQKKADK
jgi:uncharacterized protein YdbL (DUF1318 family)